MPTFLHYKLFLGTNKKCKSNKLTGSFLVLDSMCYLVFAPGCHQTTNWRTKTRVHTGRRATEGKCSMTEHQQFRLPLPTATGEAARVNNERLSFWASSGGGLYKNRHRETETRKQPPEGLPWEGCERCPREEVLAQTGALLLGDPKQELSRAEEPGR